MESRERFPVYPGWETVRKIGNGSFGAVYEIQRNLFGTVEKAALKQISIPQDQGDVEELYSTGYDDKSITAHYESYLADIVKEYQLMAEMKGHTNVVYCDDIRYIQKDVGIGWDIFIKMELLTPLMKALDKVSDEEHVVKLGRDMASALVLCRSRNIIHRDIKPQNIFISKDGDFKLGDFGIAKTAEKTSGGTKIGTYNYMAPEVYNNQPYGHGADIYSLGLVLYWLLNDRRLPFYPAPPAVPKASEMEKARLRRFRGDPIPAPAHGGDALKRIVLKACAFDPKDRYQRAEDMLRDLEALGGTRRAGRPDHPVPEPREAETELLLDEDEPGTLVVPERMPEPEEAETGVAFPTELLAEEETSVVPAPDNALPVSEYPTELLADEEETNVIQAPAAYWDDATVLEPIAQTPVGQSPAIEQPQPGRIAPANAKKGGKKGLIFGIIGGVIALAAILLIVLLPKKGGSTQSSVEPAAESQVEDTGPLYRRTRTVQKMGETVNETIYTYGATVGRADRYTDGELRNYSLLTLNERGQVIREEFYALDGTLRSYSEQVYNNSGDMVAYRLYTADGLLIEDTVTVYDNHMKAWEETVLYDEFGNESSRYEFEMTDKFNGVRKTYENGELTETSTVVRSYDGDVVTGEVWYNSEGNLEVKADLAWDRFGNNTKIAYTYPGGESVSTESEYARIG